MKIRKNIPKIALIVFLTLILILWPMIFLSLNDGIWFLIQKRNDVVLPEEEIKVDNQQIVSFFKGKTSDLSFLTQEEVSHIQDVKNLITKANLTFFISLGLSLPTFLCLKKIHFVKSILRKVSIFVLLFLILLLILNVVGFNSFFLKFHKIFFVGNYDFPSTSMLKILYPDGFFSDIFIIYFILAVLGCLVALLISHKLKV